MVITALEPITKTKVKVFIDEEFAFMLTTSDLSALGLKNGSVLDDALYAHITDELLKKRARLKALDLLKARDYTESGLRAKLKADFYPPFLIDDALAYVRSYNYINDARFIDNFCRLNKETMSRQMLIYKLKQKGAPSELIGEYMANLETDSQPHLLRLIEHKCGSNLSEVLTVQKKKQKLINFLLRKGYTYGEIKEALHTVAEGRA